MNNLDDIIFFIKKIKILDFFNEFIFRETASSEEVENYEKQFNIKLPEDFKYFVTNIANGTIEPILGLDRINFSNFFFKNRKDYNPKYCFPFSRNISDDEIIKKDIYDESTCGYIIIQSEGCDHYFLLIVNGEKKGTIWFHEYGYYQVLKNGKNISFSEWYLERLKLTFKKLNETFYLKKKILDKTSYLKITIKFDDYGNLRIDNLSNLEGIYKIQYIQYYDDLFIMIEKKHINKLFNKTNKFNHMDLLNFIISNYYDIDGINNFRFFLKQNKITHIDI